MSSWWDRLVARSDVRQAKRAAWIAGTFIVVLLYALGGLSLYVRKTVLTPSPVPTATAISILIPTAALSPTASAPTEAPSLTPTATATLFPTITPSQ
ncbi:MAG: hypothetical protein ABFD20_08920 [Anaerolineales bacterium]